MNNTLYIAGALPAAGHYLPGSERLVPDLPVESRASASRPSYDFSGLGKLANNAGFVRELQQLFVRRVPGQLAQLELLIAAEDWLALAQEAHGLKATFGTFKMEPGASLLSQMEALAQQAAPQQQQQLTLLDLLKTTAAVVVALFKQELARAI